MLQMSQTDTRICLAAWLNGCFHFVGFACIANATAANPAVTLWASSNKNTLALSYFMLVLVFVAGVIMNIQT